MSASPRNTITLAALVAATALLASPGVGLAQYRNDFDMGSYEVPDYQYFEPVDLDLDRKPVKFTSGYWFNYNKMFWAATGERTVIGDQSVNIQSEVIFPGNTTAGEQAAQTELIFQLPDGSIPQSLSSYTIVNGVQDAPSDAVFGYADRYEMGYVSDKGVGIMIGIIDGNEVESEQVYGFESPTTNGFGSVHVNWRGSETLLAGWRDYGAFALDLDDSVSVGVDDDDDGAGVDVTLGGPGIVAGDGEIDDILFNGGTFFIIDADNDGVFTFGVDPFYIDFGDLHVFNFRYETLGVRSISQTTGIEVMGTKMLSNRHFMQKHQNQTLEVGYGARFFKFDDYFIFDGESDLIGRTFAETDVENQIIGPQLRLKWTMQQARWNLSLDGRCMLGYNVGDLGLTYGVGETAIPGAVNKPLLLQPTYGSRGRQENTFSPVVEFRADAKYLLTRSISLNVGYTAMFVDNITRAGQVVDFTLPDVGLKSGGDQDVFINGVNFGIEFWH